MAEQQISFNIARYIDLMTRKEQYEWKEYDIDPVNRLEILIDVARRGLEKERSEFPGVEKDLVQFEETQEQALKIIDRRWLLGAAAGVLAGVIEGIAAGLFFGNVQAAIGAGLTVGTLTLPFTYTLGKEISDAFIFTPAANRFVSKKLGLQK